MTQFDDIIIFVEESFLLKSENKIKNNILYLRVSGLDDVSLAKYIKEKFKDIKIKTKNIEGYYLYKRDNNWIEIKAKND